MSFRTASDVDATAVRRKNENTTPVQHILWTWNIIAYIIPFKDYIIVKWYNTKLCPGPLAEAECRLYASVGRFFISSDNDLVSLDLTNKL